MVDVGQYHYPIFPVSLLLHHRFDSEKKIASVRVPILICHGQLDNIAPCPMSDRLANAAGGPVTRLTVPDAGHNDFFYVAEEQINRTVAAFLGR